MGNDLLAGIGGLTRAFSGLSRGALDARVLGVRALGRAPSARGAVQAITRIIRALVGVELTSRADRAGTCIVLAGCSTVGAGLALDTKRLRCETTG